MAIQNPIKIYIVLEDKLTSRAFNVNGNVELFRTLLDILISKNLPSIEFEPLTMVVANQANKQPEDE